MSYTLTHMASKKKPDKHKPGRMVRIPEVMARELEQLANEQFNKLAEQVRIAVREYLERKGRPPKPRIASQPPKY